MPASAHKPRVLYVDDDANLLASIARHQRKHFDLVTVGSGAEALVLLQTEGPFAVVVSDLRMPGMDGIDLLQRMARISPDTTRIMLTGNADLEAAMRAVNDGHIFRFLTKPCAPDTLRSVIQSGEEMHRLVRAERELLEQTLRGAIDVLTEILGLVNPSAFGRASRVRKYASQLAEALGLRHRWQVEVAAMLSQIGCVTVPPKVVEKIGMGRSLDAAEQRMLRAHPEVGGRLLRGIPRLEEVSEMVRHQMLRFDGGGSREGIPTGAAIPIGARILKLALDLDDLVSRGHLKFEALDVLKGRPGTYDPELIEVLSQLEDFDRVDVTKSIPVHDLREGMVVADDIRTPNGLLLVSAGQPVTIALIRRLTNWADSSEGTLRDSIRVTVAADDPDEKQGP